MCVMERERVGIREVRQNLSVYVRRVLRGATFELTDRGRPVALLGPLPDGATALGRLIREGRVRPPAGDLIELGPPSGRPSRETSEALEAERDERL
jgi:antitoxin (DNA-binding transcriptional repressor) of toxin-antitoxin stability system